MPKMSSIPSGPDRGTLQPSVKMQFKQGKLPKNYLSFIKDVGFINKNLNKNICIRMAIQ